MKRLLALILLLATSACTPPFVATPYPCPEATQEPFFIEPIPATTDQTTITVTVSLGNMEEVTVLTESGTFTSNTGEVEVILLPNTVHHLEVRGLVQKVDRGDCTYGGYTLHTTNDKDGNPLVIEQVTP
jgi:hypothetical protein